MLARLTQNTNGQTTYEVQSGDTFMQIALDNGMTVSEMQQLNPEIDINRIYIGQLLNVREEIPLPVGADGGFRHLYRGRGVPRGAGGGRLHVPG